MIVKFGIPTQFLRRPCLKSYDGLAFPVMKMVTACLKNYDGFGCFEAFAVSRTKTSLYAIPLTQNSEHATFVPLGRSLVLRLYCWTNSVCHQECQDRLVSSVSSHRIPTGPIRLRGYRSAKTEGYRNIAATWHGMVTTTRTVAS